MSKKHNKRNRAKLNKAHTGREYRCILFNELYPIYWDECIHMYPNKKNRWAKSSNKQLFMYQMRMYKTWKHNRKTQWRE